MKKILSIGCMLLVLCSCHKKKYVYNTLTGEFKAYFDWKEGSYWIFTDSVNGSRDSFAVMHYRLDTEQKNNDRYSDDYRYETVTISINEYHANSPDSYRVWTLNLTSLRGNENSTLYSASYDPGADLTRDWPFSLNGEFGGNAGDEKNIISRALLNSTDINHKSYNDVYWSQVIYPQSDYEDAIVMNASSGFIRIAVNRGPSRQILLLEESHINR